MVRMYKCPVCGNPLYKKDNLTGIGQFYNCEHCGYIKSSWDVNNLNAVNFADSTLNRCPRCGGAIIQKLGGPRGVFYGCVNYPRCDFAYSSSDQNVSSTFTYTMPSSTKSFSNKPKTNKNLTMSQKKQTYQERIDEKIGQNSKSKIVQKKHTNYNESNKKFNPKPGESYNDYLFRINSEQKVSHPKAKKESERLEREETFNDQYVKQNNNTKKWAIILSTVAICLIIIIAAMGINNNGEYGVTDELENQNSSSGVHLSIRNDEDYGDTIKKGQNIIVIMKDTTYWESMTGCVVSVNLKHKETGEEYNGDFTIGENSYAYIDTAGLPLGEYELYASYYGDEDHYVNYYNNIEIVD